MTAGLVDVRHAAGADFFKDLVAVIQQLSDVSVHQARSFPKNFILCALPSDSRQRDGHVVGCAAVLGDVQQPLAAVAFAQTVDDLKEHFLIGHFVGKAVRAEQNALVAAQAAGEDIALDLRLGADGAGDDCVSSPRSTM